MHRTHSISSSSSASISNSSATGKRIAPTNTRVSAARHMSESSASTTSSGSASSSPPASSASSLMAKLNMANAAPSGAPKQSMQNSNNDDDDDGGDYGALDDVICLDDLEQMAKSKLDQTTFDYFCHGADEELTLKWNRQMISYLFCLRPRVLCDVSRVDLTKYIYGDKLSMPVGLSPTAMHKMLHPQGELATVRACDRANALMILSMFATTSLEDVAKEAPICVKWQNMYILKNRDITQNIINRAIRYNYRALVVTCDAPTLGNRRRDRRNHFTLGNHTLENIQDSSVQSMRDHSSSIFDPSITWQHLADLKKGVGDTIRVIAKGIMTPEDAEQALRAGVDGIFVSNHGGRQLDGAQSTIEALPAIVRAVNKRCPVFVDGGFRNGSDVLKALALGADMVFVGRPPIYGLAAHGEQGVYKALQILKEELQRAMTLCGCTKISDISRNIVMDRPPSAAHI